MFKKLVCISFVLLMSCAFNQEFQTPIDISFPAQDALNPQISFDNSGNGVCVWYNSNDTNYIIQATRTTDGGATFSSPIDLSLAGRDAFNPQISFDNSGNGVCVWQRSNGTNTIIQAARTTDGGATFSTPIDLSHTGQDADSPQISFDNSGNGVCVWNNSTDNVIQAARTTNGGATFLTPVDVSIAGKVADSPQISFDPISGNGVCVWHNATDNIIQAAQTTDGGATFLTPIALSPAGKVTDSPQISFDNSGNGVCVWNNSTDNVIQAARTTNGGATFLTPIDVSIAGNFSNFPQISFDNSGNGVCVWERSNGTNFIIQAARTTNGGATFLTPIDLSLAGQDAAGPQISFDNSGNGICVWVRSNGSHNIIQAAETINGGTTFLTPVDVSLAGRNANVPQISFDNSGNGVCVWYRFNGIEGRIIQASSIAGQSPAVTLSVSGSQFKISSLFQKDIVNKISWDSIPGAASYKVYDSSNALLFQGLELSFFDHDKKQGKTYQYFVTWVNNLGAESTPVAVSIP